MNPQVSILIPHFRTLELTKFCLRSIKKYSNLERIQVIVIDNGSKDESTLYLRGLQWIELVERDTEPGESVAAAHARALDLGLTKVIAPYVLSIHTDTIIISPEWLDFLLGEIDKNPEIAGVGSWKLEFKPWHRRFAKQHLEPLWEKFWNRLRKPGPRKTDNHYMYLRSHCAMYRTELLRRFALSFNNNDVAGKVLHRKLEEQGFVMKFLDIYGLGARLRHINHATMILNPEIAGRKTGTATERRRVRKELEKLNYMDILDDSSLD